MGNVSEMLRREFILLGAAAIAVPAAAQTNSFVDALVLMLQEQGYKQFRISRTWLGRLRIRAISDMSRREIIMNPRTGEILRDYWELIGAEGESKSGLFKPDDDDGYHNYDDDDDDYDDDDEDDDDTDNSGHGGGGSDSSGPGSGD
ncbi:MAG: hypothetical protein ACU0DI_04330 [Paracoccaceae bacterium]